MGSIPYGKMGPGIQNPWNKAGECHFVRTLLLYIFVFLSMHKSCAHIFCLRILGHMGAGISHTQKCYFFYFGFLLGKIADQILFTFLICASTLLQLQIIRNPYVQHLSGESALHKYSLHPCMVSYILHSPLSYLSEVQLRSLRQIRRRVLCSILFLPLR